MEEQNCFLCEEMGCEYTCRNVTQNKVEYYCSLGCLFLAIRIDRVAKAIEFIRNRIRVFSNLRDSIKEDSKEEEFHLEWKGILPFVYGWLMFYLALKRQDTRSRLEKLFNLAVKKNQEVFNELDGNQRFKEKFPQLFHAVSKHLVKASLDKTEELIDLITNDFESETV